MRQLGDKSPTGKSYAVPLIMGCVLVVLVVLMCVNVLARKRYFEKRASEVASVLSTFDQDEQCEHKFKFHTAKRQKDQSRIVVADESSVV